MPAIPKKTRTKVSLIPPTQCVPPLTDDISDSKNCYAYLFHIGRGEISTKYIV